MSEIILSANQINYATAEDDTIYGSTGNDTVYGLDGNDRICLSVYDGGNDVIYGGLGNDDINAGSGNDYLDGSSGDDYFTPGAGINTISGGDGTDRLVYSDERRSITLDTHHSNNLESFVYLDGVLSDVITGIEEVGTGYGNDSITLDDSSNHGFHILNGGHDTVTGGPLQDIFYCYDFAGSATLNGGDGVDFFFALDTKQAISINLLSKTINFNAKFYGTFNSIEYFTSGAGNDTLTGAAGNDNFFGGDGDDSISSGAGNDFIEGGTGKDTIIGGAGDDRIYGGAGNDVISTTSGLDWVYGGEDNDKLTGSKDADHLEGDSGNDTVTGGNGNDSLWGSQGNDLISGGSGVDYIWGGAGNDTLSGGSGKDRFHFGQDGGVSASNMDTITDFRNDEIYIYADVFINQSFISVKLLSDAALGEGLIYEKSTGILYYDADGAGTGDLAIAFVKLIGKPTLSVANFYGDSVG